MLIISVITDITVWVRIQHTKAESLWKGTSDRGSWEPSLHPADKEHERVPGSFKVPQFANQSLSGDLMVPHHAWLLSKSVAM